MKNVKNFSTISSVLFSDWHVVIQKVIQKLIKMFACLLRKH